MAPRIRRDLLGLSLSTATLVLLIGFSVGILLFEGRTEQFIVGTLWAIGLPLDSFARWANRRRCERAVAREREALTIAIQRGQIPVEQREALPESYAAAQPYERVLHYPER